MRPAGDVIIERLLGKSFETGYNAMEDKVENLMDVGVLDPAKVTRSGLQNACGIAGIMLTTQVRVLILFTPLHACLSLCNRH